jgi:amino acid transporter
MLASNLSDHSERTDLVRGLGLGAATTLVLIAWILGLLIVLVGAFCYAELGAALPKVGGPYVYLDRGLGPLRGSLSGSGDCPDTFTPKRAEPGSALPRLRDMPGRRSSFWLPRWLWRSTCGWSGPYVPRWDVA